MLSSSYGLLQETLNTQKLSDVCSSYMEDHIQTPHDANSEEGVRALTTTSVVLKRMKNCTFYKEEM